MRRVREVPAVECATFGEEGYPEMLLALIEGSVWECRLYTNDPPVTKALRAEDLVEVLYDGYAPAPLVRWTPPALRWGVSFSVHDPVEFRFTAGDAPLPVVGYYVTHKASGKLAWARKRPGGAFPLGPDSPLLILYLTLEFPPAA